jgi:hypothetical protein
MLKKILATFLVVLNVIICYAGTIDPNTSDSEHIKYAKDFVYVGKIVGISEKNETFSGSCVAINDHHILTAAHVVKGSRFCAIIINDKTIALKKIIIHKDFDSKKFGKADIALGYCEQKISLSFYPDLYTEKDEVGKLCCMAGYGKTGTFETGATKYDSKKRAGSNFVDYIDKDMLICSPSKAKTKKSTSLEFLIASGDSGGGLFIDNKLAGIHSCVMAIDKSPSSKYNEESGHTRISIFADWVLSNLEK